MADKIDYTVHGDGMQMVCVSVVMPMIGARSRLWLSESWSGLVSPAILILKASP